MIKYHSEIKHLSCFYLSDLTVKQLLCGCYRTDRMLLAFSIRDEPVDLNSLTEQLREAGVMAVVTDGCG